MHMDVDSFNTSVAKVCFHTSDVGLKGIYCKRKYESKGGKNSLHQTIKRKKIKITLCTSCRSNTVTFFCIHFKTPSIVHFPLISPAFPTGILTSWLCISQPNRMWHTHRSDNQQEKTIIIATMTCMFETDKLFVSLYCASLVNICQQYLEGI